VYLHRKQFIVGLQPIIISKKWKSYQLDTGLWLSHCADLQVTKSTDIDGQAWYILGLAVETLMEKDSPEKEIAKAETSQVCKLCESWAGRWLLIGDGKLSLDASGLSGCFYGKDSKGQVWASSSAALLSQIFFPEKPPVVDSRKLSYEVGISWYTPPLSRFERISRLLPSQMLNMISGEIQPKPLMPKINIDRDYDEVLNQIQQILITTLQRLSTLSPDLWLGLTAGYDSRLMLALSQVAGIQVRPFTRITARMSVADRLLPPKLAKACGYNHTFMINPKRYPERQTLAEDHTGGHVSEGDAEPFIQGIRDRLSGISFGGHGFSVASGFYKLPELPEEISNAEEGAKHIARIFQEPINSSAMAGIKTWLSWALDHPQQHLNWRDRFFIEQRQAGWLSSKEQLYDLTEVIRFPILNSAYLYSLMLGVKPEQRLGSEIQRELIHRINPKLGEYPYNPDDMYFGLLQVFKCKAQYLPKYLSIGIGKKIYGSWSSLIHKF